MANNKYREYFDIDEAYFPCIDDSAINAGAPWDNTYPHETFISLLKKTEYMLGGSTKRSLWIHGAYGTGKSQCALALRKILEAPEDELQDYWKKYELLQKHSDLLQKLLGHKSRGIVTAHRYASGGISTPREFFFAIQESLKAALISANAKHLGENTLKDNAIAWIKENKFIIDELLKKPKWSAVFSQSTADEVLSALQRSGDVRNLMNNLFRLAEDGITAFSLDAESLKAWIRAVIKQNDIKIVFVWDEFSGYFKNNNSLDEFQNIVSLCQEIPFYLIVVTHQTDYVMSNQDQSWKVVRQRFDFTEITLPDNIAFELIGHAFNVKQSAKDSWNVLVDGDLNEQLAASRTAVMKAAKIEDPQVMKNIVPIHPIAALILKNIASAFQSNQRSMFDFIKSSNMDDVKAFQWFIETTGPEDDHPLLTVDMLWNFFYENGKDNLTSDIRLILDTFPQQQNLREDEQAVLKAVLIMQAIDQRLGGAIDLFKATEQNLSYVFEGISSGLDVSCKNLAKGLEKKGILVLHPISGGRSVYVAAVLAGDQAKIDGYKKDVRQSSTTSKLVTEGGLSTVLSLSPALRLRFESELNTGKITPVTVTDFTRTINIMRDKATGWNFHAVIAFSKDETEAAGFRKTIKEVITDKQYENIVFIDALSTPLGMEAFEQYVEFSAMAMYYNGNNNTSSRENSDKARRVLDQEWKNRIYNGHFVVYTYTNQEGEKLGNGQGVTSVLQTIVTTRFPLVFDFAKNLTENQMKLTQAKPSAKGGITQSTSGVVVGIEKHVLPTVWNMDRYWENPTVSSLSITKIKIEVDKLIEDAFQSGQISIGEIYDFLENKYGFAPCNLSAFITGFLLKEYGSEPYRYSDSSSGHEPMTPDKLAEMIGNYIGKTPKPTYIVKMTPDEKAFYELTEKAWDIIPNSCSSVGQAASAVTVKMRGLGLPVWGLEEIDAAGVFDVVRKYIELVQKEGNEAHTKAVEIGKIASTKPTLADNLFALLKSDKCRKGMEEYLRSFEGGRIMELAKEIDAEDNVIADIRKLFGVKHSCLWDKQTGEDEIRKLLTEYGIVKKSNAILDTSAHSLSEAFKEWRERLKFLGISCETLRVKYPTLSKVFDTLLKVYQHSDVLPDQLKVFLLGLTEHSAEIKDLLNNDKRIFAEVYALYLENLSVNDINDVKGNSSVGLYELSKTDCNSKVKEAAEEYRKSQLKTQLFKLWRDKTGTKNPHDWSVHHRTPILCCVSEAEFGAAKKSFETLNRSWGTDAEIKAALEFLETTELFDVLSDEEKCNVAFVRDIIGEYRAMLPELGKVRDALEHLSIEGDTYGWYGNPTVKNKVKQLAEAEYNSGGSDKALHKIDEMDDLQQLKQYLKRLVKESMAVGIEILASGGGK
ncbi:hypothetical protein [Desulfosporosinus shakirovi]|uniref:hypothetical protein n=1 Tax=Desulfosporosinus shakirovi TaxID=2885154 RepID=UPI001E2D6A77|nr:hypothetical protein [Desulfosporosinus sp. SRJS8]MCB8817402.1 hypothetical protein [Desulfosporosinus sp. SRJS8]